jgi:FixJ family two-component response regulator/DNA-binding winged helix-turn-helix (wHTH) protein
MLLAIISSCRRNGFMSTAAPDGIALEFGQFRLLERERSLYKNGKLCKIGGREFDLLLTLACRPGEVVRKTDLMQAVWPNTCVEHGNLRSQMCNLRETLGEDAAVIKTVPGRGYILSVAVKPIKSQTEAADDQNHMSANCTHETRSTAGAERIHDNDVVAVIDDDKNVRESLEELFLSVGIKTATFASVRDYIQAYSAMQPACFVIDVMMPHQTGLEFLDTLKQKYHRTRAIFISGHADVRMSVRAMKAGAVDFFTKPVDCEQLLVAVQSAISAPAGKNAEVSAETMSTMTTLSQ